MSISSQNLLEILLFLDQKYIFLTTENEINDIIYPLYQTCTRHKNSSKNPFKFKFKRFKCLENGFFLIATCV